MSAFGFDINTCESIDQMWAWAFDSSFEWCTNRVLGIILLFCVIGVALIVLMKLLMTLRILMRDELDEVWDLDEEAFGAIFDAFVESFLLELYLSRKAHALARIPRILTPQRYLTEDDLSIQNQCIICWEMFAIGEGVPQIQHPCLKNNNFTHNACLKKWFKEKAETGKLRCPICRGGIK